MKNYLHKNQKKIFDYLDKLPACVIEVKKLCKPENRDKFIEVVKSYIDEKGSRNGYVVEFSGDYSKIRKFEIIL